MSPTKPMTLPEIIAQLEACRFECEAGPLEMNVAFVELKKMTTRRKKKMHDFKVLVVLLERLTPIYVQAEAYEIIEGILIFLEDGKRKASFANGKWYCVMQDKLLTKSTATDGAR